MQVDNALSKALRRNRLKNRLPSEMKRLSDILGRAVDIAQDVETADSEEQFERYLQALEECREGKRYHFYLKAPARGQRVVKRVLAQLKANVVEVPMRLYWQVGVDIVAVRIMSTEVFDHALALVSLDQNDLYVSTLDDSTGMYLSYYTERVAGASRSEYEMIIWGNQFTALLLSLWEQGVGDIGLVTPVAQFARQRDESFEQ
ncbi:MAG: hypothetical protein KatS3mg022_0433 [Armatimonadota bacterium]|nr:MAG: hypothetical protein KatS3mg022_0433 [Armatimonadota bacterium]